MTQLQTPEKPDPLEYLPAQKRELILWRQERAKNAIKGTETDLQLVVPRINGMMSHLLNQGHISSPNSRTLTDMQWWPRTEEGIRGHLFFVLSEGKLVEVVSPQKILITPEHDLVSHRARTQEHIRSELFILFDLLEMPIRNESQDGKEYQALRVLRFK